MSEQVDGKYPEPVPTSPNDRRPDTLATPEGDMEDVQPVPDGMQVPRGNRPDNMATVPEKAEKKPSGIEKFIDEVERGEYM